MAIEIRRIILEQFEFQAVLNVFARSEESKLPQGYVIGYDITKEKPLTVFVNIQTPAGEQIGLELDEDTMVHALIHYCIETKIPVSRKSKKTVKMHDGKISFDMSLINPSFTNSK